MTKTLGQIACEAEPIENCLDVSRWGCLSPETRRVYEAMAAAVAAEVRKQCIAACEVERLEDPCKGEDEAYMRAIDHCIAAIEALK